MQNKIKANIGDKFIDDDGNIGIVGILWDDGDFTIKSVVMHANPRLKEKNKTHKKKNYKCNFCDKLFEIDDFMAAIIRHDKTVVILDKTLYKFMDHTQKQPVFICPKCLFQLKNSIAKIDFKYLE